MNPLRRIAAAVSAAVAALAFAPAAHAGLLAPSAENCTDDVGTQVFLPWADPANYVPAPGAAAESAAGWTLDGASIVPGNEPWHVISSSDRKSLHVPAGASATTDTMCVGIEHPTLRFFVNQKSGGVFAGLKVEVLFDGPAGLESMQIGTTGGYGWHPTPVMVIPASLLPVLPGERTAVAFRFSAMGGSFGVDDVHVDPWARK